MRNLHNKLALESLDNPALQQAIIRRNIRLKDRALKVIKAERRELIHRLALVGLKDTLEGQIKANFDPVVSRKLDCVNFLLEN